MLKTILLCTSIWFLVTKTESCCNAFSCRGQLLLGCAAPWLSRWRWECTRACLAGAASGPVWWSTVCSATTCAASGSCCAVRCTAPPASTNASLTWYKLATVLYTHVSPPAPHLFSALVTGVGVGPCITVIGAMVYSSVNLHVTAFWFTSINFSNGVGVVCVEKMYV